MYEWTERRMARAGYEHYEISNWARPGRRCAHNLLYWRNQEYIGLGAGAHSFIGGVRCSNALLPERYAALVEESASGAAAGRTALRHVVAAETITPALSMSDTLVLGLRLNEGIDLAAFAARYGEPPDAYYGGVIEEFTSHGLLERTSTHLRLTARGRLLSNELFQRLLPEPQPAA
jgi:oxygen-independent coproporphyrinogen-3 oxidase